MTSASRKKSTSLTETQYLLKSPAMAKRLLSAIEGLKNKGKCKMPEISRFLGIVIYMYYNDHNPPHFHAKYEDYEITINIESGVVEGKFPKRALNLVLEWYERYKNKLIEDWHLLSERKPLKKIPPLE